MTNDEQNVTGQAQNGEESTGMAAHSDMPAEVKAVLPHLQGEVDEDPVLDAQEAAADKVDAAKTDDDGEYEEEFIDADDLMELLGQMKEMLENQSKEIRGLRREMRELRESQGSAQGGFRPREDRGGFNDRNAGERGGDRGGFRPREDRGGYQGGQGSFRPREDRDFRPREERSFGGNEEGGFRPRARADRGWTNKRTDEE